MYTYESPIGIMKIYHDEIFGDFVIRINDEICGCYHSAVAAANGVFTFTTGYKKWDSLSKNKDLIVSVPTNLDEWQKISP